MAAYLMSAVGSHWLSCRMLSPALRVWQSPASCLSKALCCLEQGLWDSKDVLAPGSHDMTACGSGQDELFSLQGKAPKGLLMAIVHLWQCFTAIFHHGENLKMLLNLFINFCGFFWLVKRHGMNVTCLYICSPRQTCWTLLWTLLFYTQISLMEEKLKLIFSQDVSLLRLLDWFFKFFVPLSI